MATYDYDDYYIPNRACRCLRCSSRWLMGPAVLITVGVLFLLQQMHIFWFDFNMLYHFLLKCRFAYPADGIESEGGSIGLTYDIVICSSIINT